MRETLLTLLEAGASGAPEKPALIDIDERFVNYKDLLDRAVRASEILVSHGIQRGDRVAWIIANGPDAAEAFLAISIVATATPISPTATFEEVRSCLETTLIQAIVTVSDDISEAISAAESLHLPIFRLTSRWSSGEIPTATLPRTTQTGPLCEGPRPDDVALLLQSTGGDADLCPIPLTHRNLVTAARQIALSLNLQPEDRCLNLAPLDSMHGLMGCLLSSLVSQSSVICAPGFRAAQMTEWLAELRPTWFSAVPSTLQAWMERLTATHERIPSHSLRFVRSCSAPLPTRLQKDLEQVLTVPVIDAYTVSEAGHQVASTPFPPQRRKPGSVGLPTGTQVGIIDDAGQFRPPGIPGEIVVRGDAVTSGPLGNRESPPHRFIQGWYRTGDLGWMDSDGYLFLSGRLHEVIHRGGDRILPREVEEVLVTHPGVAEAICFPRPHPTLGEDLIAAVVLREGASATENGLRAFSFDRLPNGKVPSRILILDHFPKGPWGKVQRDVLAQRLASHFFTRHLPPRDDLERLVTDIWEDVLESEGVGINDNFFGLGGDSVLGARIVARINDLFQLALPVAAIFRHPAVGQFTDELKRLTHPALLETIAQNVRDLGALSQQDVLDLLSSTTRRPPPPKG